MKLPVVAIVGRPNVGKSSLLNALAGRRISIVQDMPGVTRDRVSYYLWVDGKYIELVDTGGYGFVDDQGLTEHIKHQIEIAMARADMVFFVGDCTTGVTTADAEIAQLLRQQSIKTVVLVNKADGPKADPAVAEFSSLGFGNPIGISAINDRNLDQVLAAVRATVDLTDAPTEMPPPQMHIAIVGKRNAGKSTMVNAIAKLYEDDPQRVIVSEVPGTTRDSVDVRFEKDGKALVVIDTAGVRKMRHMVTNDIAFYSFHRAERSIRRADVVLMLIDASEPVSEPDKKLATYIAEQMKPVILVINKWDIARETLRERAGEKFRDTDAMEAFGKYLGEELRFLDYAPIAFTTAKDGKNIQGVLDLAQHLYHQTNERVGTGRLNAALEAVLKERAPSAKVRAVPKVYYATQVSVAPPTIVLFVNKADYIDENYRRFVTNRFRELLPYGEVPINIQIRGRSRDREGLKPGAESASAAAVRAQNPANRESNRAGNRAGNKTEGRAGNRAENRSKKPADNRPKREPPKPPKRKK
ncbi:MAG: ribosome biogenesis GTPase Der [Burkholderiales bacterium]|nr:ribosome biogenesis GTPase Der [Phycisphaerae bacterium]